MRISFANLDDHVYDDIGRAWRHARGYRHPMRQPRQDRQTGQAAKALSQTEQVMIEQHLDTCIPEQLASHFVGRSSTSAGEVEAAPLGHEPLIGALTIGSSGLTRCSGCQPFDWPSRMRSGNVDFS